MIGCRLSLPKGARVRCRIPHDRAGETVRSDGPALPFRQTAMCPAGVGATKACANGFSPRAVIMVCDLVAQRHLPQSLDPDARRRSAQEETLDKCCSRPRSSRGLTTRRGVAGRREAARRHPRQERDQQSPLGFTGVAIGLRRSTRRGCHSLATGCDDRRRARGSLWTEHAELDTVRPARQP